MTDDESTVIPGDDEVDRTVVVVRRGRGRPEPVLAEDTEDTEDRTTVIDRGLPDDDTDRTVPVRRREPEPDDTDRTVALDPKRPAPAPEPDPVIRLLPARSRIEPPPGPEGARTAVGAVGPNAVDTYVPRPLPAPVAAPPVPRSDAPRRGDAALPSVARSSRASGRAALVVFAATCVVSLAGLIAVVVWFVRG